MLKKLDLPQSPLCKDFLAEDIGDFFNGDTLSSMIIGSCTVLKRQLKLYQRRTTEKVEELYATKLVAKSVLIVAYQTIPYAPWPNSLVTLYRSSTMKSWLKTLKTLRPWRSAMLEQGDRDRYSRERMDGHAISWWVDIRSSKEEVQALQSIDGRKIVLNQKRGCISGAWFKSCNITGCFKLK